MAVRKGVLVHERERSRWSVADLMKQRVRSLRRHGWAAIASEVLLTLKANRE